ncbi:PDDEXK nuclease domain-containing protein [Enterocloster clostridioformis]|nr:PDDEXK nuclease domain-containing protein [Enterocloster clostridioformis]
MINLYWEIGKFVSVKTKQEGWGRSTVKKLSQYILSKEPGIHGYSGQNIWRMKQFFETYQNKPELSTLLRANTWSNNLHIMSKTKSDEEKVFYLKLASKEKYKARELERQIDSGYFERVLLSDGKAPSAVDYTETTGMIRDLYMLEFLNLQEPYKEFDLKQAILKNMKQFLLEFGRDFIFMGEEYHLQVGKNDYFVDLLFFHRELQCLVAIDLKIDDFKPEYLGKMEFYLEALDRDVKKQHENPSVGIILCKSKDKDVVEYALSRNMTSTMISEYRTKLISKEILQKKLEELYDTVDNSQNSQHC